MRTCEAVDNEGEKIDEKAESVTGADCKTDYFSD